MTIILLFQQELYQSLAVNINVFYISPYNFTGVSNQKHNNFVPQGRHIER